MSPASKPTDQPDLVRPYLHTAKHRDVLASRLSLAREALKLYQWQLDHGSDESCPRVLPTVAAALEVLAAAVQEERR